MFDAFSPAHRTNVSLPQSPLFAAGLARLGLAFGAHRASFGDLLVLHRRWPGLGHVGVISRMAGDGAVSAAMVAAELGDLRRSLGLSHLLISPDRADFTAPLRQAGFLPLARAAQVAALPLIGGHEDWLARMDQKWRNRLRHGLRQGLAVERHCFAGQSDHWLWERDRAQQKAHGFRNIPHQVVAAMAAAEPGAAQLYLARQGRCVVAAMLFLRHGPQASYQIGWIGAAGKSASAHNVLMWEAMQDLSARGHIALDLGLLNPRKTPGIDRFKLGAGARSQEMGGTWLDSAWAGPVPRLLRACYCGMSKPGSASTKPSN